MNQELKRLFEEKINAKEVVVFDHTIREDKVSLRPAARHAHVDYSSPSALMQIDKHIDEARKDLWLKSHYAIVNTWRPIQNPVLSAPLGFVLPQSTSPTDLIDIELVYPNRLGEVKGALFNKNHRWVYLSEMKPDEIVLFKMYDSETETAVIHSAFDLKDTKPNTVRRSIESRILVRF